MTCGIYRITNCITGDAYIGQSANIERRWLNHKSRLNRGLSSCPGLQQAWNQYGPASFVFERVLECPAEELDRREQECLDQYQPAYNKATVAGTASMTGRSHTPEVRHRISQSLKGKMSAVVTAYWDQHGRTSHEDKLRTKRERYQRRRSK